MIRLMAYGGALWLLLAVQPAGLLAQVNPNSNRTSAYAASGELSGDPRVRRARREQAVAAVGPIARDFVETHGDDAVAAIFACSRPVAVKLAEFHASGELNKLPRPRDLLHAIAERGMGDDVAVWAMEHANELTDTDSFNAYLQNPLEYALGLKPLAAGAAEARAVRLNAPPAPATPAPGLTLPAFSANDWGLAGPVIAAVIFFGGLLLLRRWQRRNV